MRQFALDLIRECFPQTLRIGAVVRHPSGRHVKIVAGQYMGTHGLSNFWEWREVLPDGSTSPTLEYGYGWDPERHRRRL